MEQYCMYLRKSRKDDEAEGRGEGETLARHEKELQEFAKKRDLNITHIYKEIVSGETISARPVMKQLLNDVEKDIWTGVLVVEVERLARGDTVDQGTVAKTFKYSGTLIITPNKTYDPNDEFDEEYFEFGLFMSRREYKTINRRLQRGKITSVMEGKYVGNKSPYGYKRVKLEKEKGWTLEPEPEQAEIIKKIFDLYTVGEMQQDGTNKRLGASMIARRFNQLKIPPKQGEIWAAASVRDILINPVYTGKIRWNWRPVKKKMAQGQVIVERPRNGAEECIIVNGLHDKIIDEDIFNEAQELIAQNRSRPTRERGTVKNPLAGIVICGKCSRRMVRRPYGGNYPDTLICAVPECTNVSVRLHYAETKILGALDEWLDNYKLKWQIGDNVKINTKRTVSVLELKQKALKKTNIELGTLNKQLSKTHDLFEQEIYDKETFFTRTHELNERIQQVKNEQIIIKSDLQNEEIRETDCRTIIPKTGHIIDVYKELQSPEAKNDLLKDVLEKVIYTKEKSGRWHGSPDDFEIVLYPKLPFFKNI